MEFLIGLSILLILLIIGLPVGFSLIIAGSIGIIMIGSVDMYLASLNSIPYSALSTYELITIPLFLLMAEFMVVSGIARSMFEAIAVWVKDIRGGLGAATAITGAAFGALSGSSVASAATLTSVSVPSMRKNGYRPSFAAGITATSGGLAMLIPPSIVIIFYGILTESDIAKLLIGGIIPGLMLAVGIIVVVQVMIIINPKNIDTEGIDEDINWQSKLSSIKIIWPFLLLFTLVTGVIYTGIATPVEASALGAFGAMVLCLFTKSLSWNALKTAIINTIITTSMISFILVGAGIFGLFVTLTGVAPALLHMVGDLNWNPTILILLIAFIYLVMGLFLDTITILVLTLPVVQPIIEQLGYDKIWFGIVAILLVEIGLITPPLGLNVFIVSRVAKMPVLEVFKGTTPFVLMQIIVALLLISFPSIVMWLPMQMK